jgi:hypothetical protein
VLGRLTAALPRQTLPARTLPRLFAPPAMLPSQMTGSLAHVLDQAGSRRYLGTQVMSVSAKPRLADQQPSSAVGCSG